MEFLLTTLAWFAFWVALIVGGGWWMSKRRRR
jgi:LPXTG-motif cell wall-anchored protein